MRERFDEKYEIRDMGYPTPCWMWIAATDEHGYGRIRGERRGPMRMAHVVAYELYVGPIPEGLEPDHLCRQRACVKPHHLEPVTHQENAARAGAEALGVCRKGHPWVNPIIDRKGNRQCRKCHNIVARNHRLRKKEAMVR